MAHGEYLQDMEHLPLLQRHNWDKTIKIDNKETTHSKHNNVQLH